MTIKQRLEHLEKLIEPDSIMVSVVSPDGRIKTMNAYDWWNNRKEYPLADFDQQTNEAGNVIFLVLAALADEAIQKAQPERVPELEKERHDMLVSYFGREAAIP